MVNKNIFLDTSAREKIQRGINLLANTVGSTLGPAGKTVILESDQGGCFMVTKDGVSVAKCIKVKDPVENAGIQLAKEAALKTNSNSGDGTTTATILADAIYSEGLKNIENVNIKHGIKEATKFVIDQIHRCSTKVSDVPHLTDIAKISSNGDIEIAEAISKAFDEVGENGVVTVEKSDNIMTTVDLVEGTQLPVGYASPYFINSDSEGIVDYSNPTICITDEKITSIKQIMPMLTASTKVGDPLVILAEDFESDVLATLVINNMQGRCKICAVKLALYGESRFDRASDLAVITGATLISEKCGTSFDTFKVEHFGKARTVTVTADKTTFIGGKGSSKKIDELKHTLMSRLDNIKDKKSHEYYQVRSRLNYVEGGVAIIKVGAATAAEMAEKKDRVDDAICAVRAALSGGVVPGGATTYVKAACKLHDEIEELAQDNILRPGMRIIENALYAPITRLFKNASRENILPTVLAKLSSSTVKGISSMVYDIHEDKWVEADAAGVIDPANVLVDALTNASSVATLLLTSSSLVVNDPEEMQHQQQYTPNMMGC